MTKKVKAKATNKSPKKVNNLIERVKRICDVRDQVKAFDAQDVVVEVDGKRARMKVSDLLARRQYMIDETEGLKNQVKDLARELSEPGKTLILLEDEELGAYVSVEGRMQSVEYDVERAAHYLSDRQFTEAVKRVVDPDKIKYFVEQGFIIPATAAEFQEPRLPATPAVSIKIQGLG
jgi:hypothetical protein